MRLRNNPKALDILEENKEFVVLEPTKFKNKWSQVFNNDHPIYIEVGMGKGDFIYNNAVKYPDINFIGIEKYPSVLAIATKKVQTSGVLPNLRLMSYDAIELLEVFEENEISLVYLNFSDPWPKSRHAKRRLTSETFLPIYQNIINQQGHLEFKTDNRGLFEYSLVSFQNYGMKFEQVFLDLHQTVEAENNIMTEYERKFCEKGPIYKFVGRFEA
ncbi:tRNA (guanosine(46)-N7)-methyltransferase TrmB [Tannockella kyphosi]|uniref:tRNA (guanosine(46)-N7)-methyltransferase TrmB n=1 Tax=Tannockella kyphosi TaxID=2899121 RepID=UPI0020139F6B|nr:tRNA (guanosine(46)-N7)-methyltransferase TrmB [Tannockella kyphosi]